MDLSLEALAPYLAGLIGVPVVSWAKNQFGWEGKPVVILAAVISVVLAVVAMAASGELSGVDLLEDGAKAFAAATLIYKLI